jgi:flagellin-like hook-associated protein FlgL
MRVTHKSIYNVFNRSLDEIQARRIGHDLRLTTGKDIVNLEERPADVVDVKRYGAKIEQNSNYQGIIDETVRELYHVDETLRNVSDFFNKARETAIESQQLGVQPNLTVLANYIKGYISDAVKLANEDFNGHSLFAGTKTRDYSLDTSKGDSNGLPFELVEGEPTAENPSGMTVIFKGNFEDRVINKDEKTTEVVNVRADELFGEGGVEIFNDMINLYNLINFKDGRVRQPEDYFVKEDTNKLNQLQQKLSQNFDEVNRITSKVGTKINRLEAIATQMSEEEIRLKDFKSYKEDADIAEVAMNLKREETLLNYTLQVGSRISQNTLFDFLR